MRLLMLSVVTTAALVEGVIIGIAIGGAVAACACRKPRSSEVRERPKRPEPEGPEG